MAQIALIAPSKEIEKVARKTKEKYKLDMDIFLGLMEDGVEIAKKLYKKDYKVFITRGGTSLLLRRVMPDNVIEIKMSLDDAIHAIMTAKKYGGRIHFVGFENHLQGFSSLGPLLNLNITQTVVTETVDIYNSVKKAQMDGINVIIGGAIQAKAAEQINMPSVFLTTNEEGIYSAFNEANSLLSVILNHERREKEVRTVLDYSGEGFIAIDVDKNITMANRFAMDIFGLNEEEIIGKPVNKVLRQIDNLSEALRPNSNLSNDIITIGSFSLLYDRISMFDNGKITGAMAIIKDIKKVLEEDSNIRNMLHSKGLYAKYTFADIMGKSPSIINSKKIANQFARTESTILITSETGTGKEMFVQSIHNASTRKNGPFVAINCASLAESILESELFGYVEGAFTGARRNGKAGVFEMAKGGTIFLDEIAEIPLNLQGKLLRVLQEHSIMRLGDDKIIPIDVRVITATHHNLIDDVREGKFRSDLFYRLNVLHFSIPPLKDRKEDIVSLARYFLQKHGVNSDLILSSDVMYLLNSYEWPGNIRELENLMERIVAIGNSQNIYELVTEHINACSNLISKSSVDYVYKKEKITKEIVLQVLEDTNGNKTEAAKILGINRSTIWRLLNQ